MLNEILLGSWPALTICGLSIFCLYTRLVPTYYFAAALVLWLLYSGYRLFGLLTSRSRTSETQPTGGGLAYWLGALGSSLIVPLIWMLVVSRIRVF